MAVLAEIQQDIQRVARHVGPSVVGIGERWGVGSGVVVDPGRVLTNAHNLRSERVLVTFADGRTADGQVRGLDYDKDLAVVDVDTGASAAIEWATDAAPGIGTPVFAIANPGGGGLRVTVGFVTGIERTFRGPRGRRITGTIEHDAPLLPGSSGGPIVTPEGRLLGLNTNRLGEGFYLAIPAGENLRTLVEALTRGEAVARPRLGIGVAPGHVARRLRRAVGLPDVDGVLVRQVEEGGPASQAGLASGDLIVVAAGRPIQGIDDLFEAVDSAHDGGIELTVIRGAEERTVVVNLGLQADG
jgi:S1-C subfamily serine protease